MCVCIWFILNSGFCFCLSVSFCYWGRLWHCDICCVETWLHWLWIDACFVVCASCWWLKILHVFFIWRISEIPCIRKWQTYIKSVHAVYILVAHIYKCCYVVIFSRIFFYVVVSVLVSLSQTLVVHYCLTHRFTCVYSLHITRIIYARSETRDNLSKQASKQCILTHTQTE